MNLVDLIINKMPENLTDLEKARFIYLELGKFLEFDTTTINNSSYSAYINQNNKDINIENLKTNEVTCYNWAHIYIRLLDRANIKAAYSGINHTFVIININGVDIKADDTLGGGSDLANIKSHQATKGFFPIKYNNAIDQYVFDNNKDIINQISLADKKFGYTVKVENSYNFISRLKEEVSKMNSIKEKIDYLFSNVDFKGMGFFEGNSYIKYLIDFCIEKRFGINASTLSKTDKKGKVESIKCITVKENNNTYYYIFSNANGIQEIKKSDLKLLSMVGYENEDSKKISHIKEQEILNVKSLKLQAKSFSGKIAKFVIDKLTKNKFNYNDSKIKLSNDPIYKKFSIEHGFKVSNNDIGSFMSARLPKEQINNIINNINNTGYMDYETGIILQNMINNNQYNTYIKTIHSNDLESIFNEGIRCLGTSTSGMGMAPNNIDDIELGNTITHQSDLPLMISDIKHSYGISQGSNIINGTLIMQIPKDIKEKDIYYYNNDSKTYNIKPEFIVGFLKVNDKKQVDNIVYREELIKDKKI